MKLKFRALVLGGIAMFAAGAVYAAVGLETEAKSENGNVVLTQATPHDRLFSLVFNGSNGLAVGDRGALVSSTDGGKTWTRSTAPTELALLDVASSGTHTIAVGQMGLILVREGQGEWKKVESGTQQRLLRVSVNAQGTAYAVGAFGTLIKSTDGGQTWASAAPDWGKIFDTGRADGAASRDEPTNYIVRVGDDGSIIVGGEYCTLLRSTDGGANWQLVFSQKSEDGRNSPTIFSMSIRKDGIGYAVGQSGFIAQTKDSGATWTELPTPTKGNLFGVDSFPDGQVVIIGQRVGMRSRDQGQTFQPITGLDLNLNWYTSLGHSDQAAAGETLGVGHSGRVIKLVP